MTFRVNFCKPFAPQIAGAVLASVTTIKADVFIGIAFIIIGCLLVVHGAWRCYCRGLDFYGDGADPAVPADRSYSISVSDGSRVNAHRQSLVSAGSESDLNPDGLVLFRCAGCRDNVLLAAAEASSDEPRCPRCGDVVDAAPFGATAQSELRGHLLSASGGGAQASGGTGRAAKSYSDFQALADDTAPLA